MSVLPAIGTFIANLMTKGTKQPDGMDFMGDFNLDGYLNANLDKAKNTPGTNLPKVTQGLARLVGLGPKSEMGEPDGSSKHFAPIVAPKKSKLNSGNLDYLGSVIQGLQEPMQ